MNAEDRNREKKSHLCVCVGVSVAGRGKKSSAQIGAHDVKPSEIAYALLSCFTSPPTFFLSLSSGSGFLFIWAIENAQRPTTTENHHQQQQKQEEEKEKMKLMFGSTFPFSSFLSPFRNKTTYTHTHTSEKRFENRKFFSFSPMLCHGPLFIFHKPNIFTGTHTHQPGAVLKFIFCISFRLFSVLDFVCRRRCAHWSEWGVKECMPIAERKRVKLLRVCERTEK